MTVCVFIPQNWSQVLINGTLQPSGRHSFGSAVYYDAGVQRSRLFIYGGLALDLSAQAEMWMFTLAPRITFYESYIECSSRQTVVVPTGSVSLDVDAETYPLSYYCDGFVDCSNMYDEGFDCAPSVLSVYVSFAVLVGVCVLGTLGVMIWLVVCRNNPFVKASSQLFCQIICVGALIAYGGLVSFFGKPSDSTCMLPPWL